MMARVVEYVRRPASFNATVLTSFHVERSNNGKRAVAYMRRLCRVNFAILTSFDDESARDEQIRT